MSDPQTHAHYPIAGKEAILATKKKAPAKKPVEDELEELEDLEELVDEVEDEEEEEDEDLDDAEDEEDTPAPKASKGKKPRKKQAREDGMIGTSELAEALETSGRELRVMLRQKKVEKNENNRYEWDSVEEAVQEMGFKSLASAKKGLAASRATRLEELKERVGKNKKEKAAAGKGTKKGKKKPAPEPEDEDEDEEFEDDE